MNKFDTHIICVDDNLVPSSNVEVFQKHINSLKESELFSGKMGEVFSIRVTDDVLKNVIFVGIGSSDDYDDLYKVESAFGKAVKKASSLKSKHILALLDNRMSDVATAKAVETMHLAGYSFDKYKTKNNSNDKEKMSISVSSPLDIRSLADEAILLAEQTCKARDLVNEPANVITPEVLAEIAVAEGEKFGFFVEVFEKEQIQEFGMEAFLSVAKGSSCPPRLIVMKYDGGGDETIALVGKGLTYDSGGYCIKPADGMLDMKSDMAGAAAVITAMGAISKNKLKVNVVAVVAACENMISGEAYHNGDIIGSMSGKYIEIVNTDAEGRLTLADAITYAKEKLNADKIIDIATLTGGAIIALGNGITAALSNNDGLWNRVERASKVSTEKVWRLPCDEDIAKMNKSKVADIKNSGGRGASAITAGLFLKEFVGDTQWVHLDIAGPSFVDSPLDNSPSGATGIGVRLLYNTVKNLSK